LVGVPTHVEVDVIRPDVSHLDVAVSRRRAANAEPERNVYVIARLRRGFRQVRRCHFEAVHLEADVMDAAPALAALDARKGVILEVQRTALPLG
jgi:hypothetical protein